ncbi:MAG: mandelate racemase/muconate lactonizing enzyme family protein, partial [Anaerolineae bacterium]
MKVNAIEACSCVVPLEKGVAFATRAVQERHFTLVRLRTDAGIEGIGFCYAGHKAGHLTTL